MAEVIYGRFVTVRKSEEADAAGRLKIVGTIGHIEIECKNLMTREEIEDLDEEFVIFFRMAIPRFSSTDIHCEFESFPKYGFIASNDTRRITIGYKFGANTTMDKITVPKVYLHMMKISFRKYGFPSKPSANHLSKSWDKIYRETPMDRFENIELTFGSYDCPLAGNSTVRDGDRDAFEPDVDAGKNKQKSGSQANPKVEKVDEIEEIDRLKGSIVQINQNIKVIAGALGFLVVTHLVKTINGFYNFY